LHSLCYRTKKFSEFKPSLLSIQRVDSAYILKTLFAKGDSTVEVLAIFNVVAAKESGKYVFHRYSEYFKTNWEVRQLGTMKFFFNSTHIFDDRLAKKSDEFNKQIALRFKMEPIPLEYYIFKNTEERLRTKGYDYDARMFDTIQKSAEADIHNDRIYASNGTEYFPHEIVHFYIFKKYGKTIHSFFDEGLATLFGGNLNEYTEDLSNVRTFIKDNPKFDLSELTHLKKSIGSTNLRYVIGAILCQAILDKGGWAALESAFRAGKKDANLYAALESILGIKKTDINRFVKNQISHV
jgi:hypothetical protein